MCKVAITRDAYLLNQNVHGEDSPMPGTELVPGTVLEQNCHLKEFGT